MSKVQGRDRLLQKLAAIPQYMRADISRAIDAGAADIVATQKRLAPKKSGALANSIKAVKGGYTPENSNVRGVSASGSLGDPELTVTIVAGDAKAWYARLVEFGTAPHKIRATRPGGLLNVSGRLIKEVSHPGGDAKPFFYPGFRANKKRVRARISRAISRTVKKYAGT